MEYSLLTHYMPRLPPMGYYDHDKARRDEDVHQGRINGAPQLLPPSLAASPAHRYSSGPPPPYTYPAPRTRYLPNTTPSTPASMHTPPESRRAIEDEREAIKQSVRQDLPSISEALGEETQLIYRPSLPLQTTPSSTHPPPPTHALASLSSPRSHRKELTQQPSKQHIAPPLHFSQYRQDAQRLPSYPSIDASRPPYAESRLLMRMQAARSPPPQCSAYHASQYAYTMVPQSPTHEQPPQHPSGATTPPSLPCGYHPYSQRCITPAPPPASNARPKYQSSLFNAANHIASITWEAESVRYGGKERISGDFVKRQLKTCDLRGALSDARKPVTKKVIIQKLTLNRYLRTVES